jgi:hypothetical protein
MQSVALDAVGDRQTKWPDEVKKVLAAALLELNVR